jgi:hypothetical protein
MPSLPSLRLHQPKTKSETQNKTQIQAAAPALAPAPEGAQVPGPSAWDWCPPVPFVQINLSRKKKRQTRRNKIRRFFFVGHGI